MIPHAPRPRPNPWPTRIGVLMGGVLIVGLAFNLRAPSNAVAQDKKAHEEALRDVVLARVNAIPGALAMLRHTAYEDDGLLVGDLLEARAPVLIVGQDGDRMIGLTTQCAASFRFPSYSLFDPGEIGEPELVAGIAELTLSGSRPQTFRFLVRPDMDWKYPGIESPDNGIAMFFDLSFPVLPDRDIPTGLRSTATHIDRLKQWHALRRARPMLDVEPLGDHDLAIVSFPAIPGTRSLSLDRPKEKIIKLIKEMPFAQMLGRDFFVRCEECLGKTEGANQKGLKPPMQGARLARIACWLLGSEFFPVAIAMEILPTMVHLADEAVTAHQGGKELTLMAAKGHLGLVLDLTRQEVIVRSGHVLEVNKQTLRLAHIRSKRPGAKEVLSALIASAKHEGKRVVAIVESVAFDGQMIAHLVVAETATYLNLSLVQSGDAEAYQHRESLKSHRLYSLMKVQERVTSLLN